MPITYNIAIDLNDDGDFIDTNEVISADVLSLRWRLGMAAPFDAISAPSEAQITLRNRAQKYSPEALSALSLLPGRRLRIFSNDGITTRLHFVGIIERVEPLPGTLSQRTSVIHAAGVEKQLAQASARLPPQINARADTVIGAILDRAPLRPSVLRNYTILDLIGSAELDFNTLLSGYISRALETGVSTFSYVGDTWADGVPAATAIRQLAESEHGRFFFDRSGDPIFYNRHHTLLDTTSLETFDNEADDLEYVYAGDLSNRVSVTVTPRSIGADGSVLWQSTTSQRVPALTTREINVHYSDADHRATGALSVLTPVAGTDYTINTAANGTGVNVTAFVNVMLMRADFSAATLEVRNPLNINVYLLPGTQLRGTPLYIDDTLTLEQNDWTSVTLYGLRALDFNLPAITSADEGEQLARFELARRRTPRGTVRRIHLSTIKHAAQILERTLFERITIKDTQTGHDAGYFIINEEHTVDLGGTRHRTTWLLEPAAAHNFVKLNLSELNDGSAYAY